MSDSMREYGLAAAAGVVCTAAGMALFPFLALTDLVMVYLLGTLVVVLRGRRGPAVLSSLLGVLCFNFFFVPPRYTFEVASPHYLVTLGVMFLLCWLAVALGWLNASHMYLALFTLAPSASPAALVAGLCWSVVFGALAGALVALAYNALSFLER